jgi:hypothetical protein
MASGDKITLLDMLKTMDGSGSGLDADKLDGKEASGLANVDLSNITSLGNILNIDGSGSGLDADKLDGLDSTQFHRSWLYSNVNANANVVARDFIKADTSGGAITLTLPASPADNNQIIVWDIKGSFNTNNCTIDGNGKNVMGATTCILDISNKKYHIIYDSNSGEWRVS